MTADIAICYRNSVFAHVAADVQYRVEPREIKARLDSPTVMSVMALGHPRSLIRQAIERRLTATGMLGFFS